MQFRILTYNIHKGIGGVDRRYRLDRTIAAIRHVVPDIIMLQEVDEGVPRSRRTGKSICWPTPSRCVIGFINRT